MCLAGTSISSPTKWSTALESTTNLVNAYLRIWIQEREPRLEAMASVRLTVVSDEMAAEVLCGRLRASGIKCAYRKTDVAAGIADGGGGFSIAGPTEVLVDERDLGDARKLLPHD